MDKRSISHITVAGYAAVSYLSSLFLMYVAGALRGTQLVRQSSLCSRARCLARSLHSSGAGASGRSSARSRSR